MYTSLALGTLGSSARCRRRTAYKSNYRKSDVRPWNVLVSTRHEGLLTLIISYNSTLYPRTICGLRGPVATCNSAYGSMTKCMPHVLQKWLNSCINAELNDAVVEYLKRNNIMVMAYQRRCGFAFDAIMYDYDRQTNRGCHYHVGPKISQHP